jgi:adenine C2-methylase RlmN of 23S rRNA A2503 and tRNA A37
VKDGILNYSHGELTDLFVKDGIHRFRADQVFVWLYRFGRTSFGEMSNIGKGLQVVLDDGVIRCVREHTVCTEGEPLTSNAVKVLKQLQERLSEFRITPLCVWENGEVHTLG